MPPVLHLLLLLIALVFFGIGAWAATAPEPWWRRLVALGLCALVASMISW